MPYSEKRLQLHHDQGRSNLPFINYQKWKTILFTERYVAGPTLQGNGNTFFKPFLQTSGWTIPLKVTCQMYDK